VILAVVTKAQIDKLGERLRLEAVTESDLRLLDEYRRSFWNSYQEVMWVLRERGRGHLEPTGRFPKTPGSIVAKLQREPSIRLTQMQDIAGCRIVVPSLEKQLVAQLGVEGFLSDAPTRVIDRRDRPSHGYRALHIVVLVRERAVEIQLRTALQHLWAELCEKLSDRFGIEVKYGGGSEQVRMLLSTSSLRVAELERSEQQLFEMEADIDMKPAATPASLKSMVNDLRQRVEQHRADLTARLRESIAFVQRDKVNGGTQ
jgi:putative GTP pyrophosphokinase